MKKRYVALFLVTAFAVSLYAMPPKPGLEYLFKNDYNALSVQGLNTVKRPVRIHGMEGVVNNAENGYQLLIAGTVHPVVVAIAFPDQANSYSIADFQSMLFGTWSSGSATDYYDEVSFGNLNLAGTVSGWLTADNNRTYYGYSSGFQRAAVLAKEAAQKADATVDFSQFDDNGDGYVDMFTVIHSGFGREETGDGSDIHSHSWSFTDAGVGVYTTNDPWPGHTGEYIKIDDYTIDPERSNASNNGTMVCIGVFCHEWGHALGLPDLYDTDYTGSGAGVWCLMASGSWGGDNSSPWKPSHLCAWAKADLGWLTPTVVGINGTDTVKAAETNALAYKLWTDGNPTNEYFLIENRQKTNFDATLYGSGLLIWHIDENIISVTRPMNKVNDGSIYGVAVEQADGLDQLLSGANRGDAADPFPGTTNNQAFDSSGTTPNSASNAGDNTHCGINQIPASSASMVANFYMNGSALVVPVADFSGTPTSGAAPLNVTFTDLSTGIPTSWSWDFGDGITSTSQNPAHAYTTDGQYTVTLIVSNADGSDTATKSNYITVGSGTVPVANFSGTPTSGNAPLDVTFTDQSTGSPTGWLWSFGDGATSTTQNPVHSYTTTGTFDVQLIAVNANGSDTLTRTGYINVGTAPQPPVAAFSGTPTSGTAPLSVTFTDQSSNSPTTWAWDFGDSQTAATQNPVHVYNTAGTYTVTLIVSNTAGTDTATQTNYITVTGAATPPTAAFTATPQGGYVPLSHRLQVIFTDQSTGTPAVSGWLWNFGDGDTSVVQNPAHVYTTAGTFIVSLIASNGTGTGTSDTAWDTLIVAVLPSQFFTSPVLASSSGEKVVLEYGLPVQTNVRLDIYGINGQLVRRILSGEIPAGEYTESWDLRDENGLRVKAGVYFLELMAPEGRASSKIVLTR